MAPLYMQVEPQQAQRRTEPEGPRGPGGPVRDLADADVLVTNMRAGALGRLGLDYDAVHERFPHLIYAHAQGFAPESSQGSRPAYDEVIQAVSGLVSLQDRAGDSLQFMPTFIADKTAALYLLNGILAALYHQQRTGEGQHVALAMADAMIAVNLVEHMAGDVFVPAAGDVGNPLSLTGAHAAMRTKDGGAIAAVPYTNEAVRKAAHRRRTRRGRGRPGVAVAHHRPSGVHRRDREGARSLHEQDHRGVGGVPHRQRHAVRRRRRHRRPSPGPLRAGDGPSSPRWSTPPRAPSA